MRSQPLFVTLLAVAVLGSFVAMRSSGSTGAPVTVKENRYVGSDRCKMCHAADEGGNQYSKWQSMKHAHAFEVLSSPEAKAAGAERGVENPAKAAECLKCHETAYGEDAAKVHPKFPREKGVQCESCHGPGEKHFEARLRAASSKTPIPVAADEIIAKVPEETCKKCHNEESPSYKPFCFKCFRAKIEHLDPRKARTKEELEERKCKEHDA